MKIRYGFVSNSSSSSFVLIGSYLKTDNLSDKMHDEFEKLYDKFGIVLNQKEDGSYLVGVELDNGNIDGYLEDGSIDVRQIEIHIALMERQLEKLGLEHDPIELHWGTIYG